MTPKTYHKLVAQKLSRNFREAATIIEVETPVPGPTELLVRNVYAGVNASDVNIAAGVYFAKPVLPFDLGVEAAGEVEAVGAQVQNFKPGDKVLTANLGSGYREYQVIDAAAAIPVPQISPELLSLVVGGLTASMGLELAGEMKSGETVLITAAAGGVGQFAVQLAKQAGNHVIGTCSTPEKAACLKDLGCDRVVNYRTEDLEAVLKAEYPNGIDLTLDGAGGAQFDAAVNNLAQRGRIVILGFIAEYVSGPQAITAPRIYHKLLWKSATLRGFLFSDYADQIPVHMQKVMTAYFTGQLKANVDPTPFHGIESIVEAVEYMHAGHNCGKVIVHY